MRSYDLEGYGLEDETASTVIRGLTRSNESCNRVDESTLSVF